MNEYYENNLRGVSMKAIFDHQKEQDKLLESRASVLDVKKLFSNLRKYPVELKTHR